MGEWVDEQRNTDRTLLPPTPQEPAVAHSNRLLLLYLPTYSPTHPPTYPPSLSILFDFNDMARQLRFLIILGKASTAVDFFIRNRGGMMGTCVLPPTHPPT